MADYSSYVPGYMAARSVWDQGIAPVAKRAQNYLKGLAQIPPSVGNYAMETLQSELGPTTQLGVDAFKLGHTMLEGIKEDPLRAVAEMYPPVGTASDLFESTRLMNMADEAEKMGDLEKANTLRGLGTTLPLLGIIPGLYHASPHIFDKFSTRHIGSGEGAQTYGHGLYFAENLATGKIYRDQLRPITAIKDLEVGGVPIISQGKYADYSPHQFTRNPTIEDFVRAKIQEDALIDESLIREAYDKGGEGAVQQIIVDDINDRLSNLRTEWPEAIPEYTRIRDSIVEGRGNKINFKPGESYLYEVDLNVEPDELLDWDAPLSGQSEAVKAKLKPIVDDIAATETPDDFNLDYVNGEELYQRLVTITRAEQDKYFTRSQRQALGRPPLPSPEELVSKRLNEAGVSGIRYYDAGSREAGEGTRNYVIFDDSVIDIRTRNGEPLTPVEREIAVEEMTPQTAGPRTPQEVDEVMESLERANINRARRIEETGLPYVPNKEPALPEPRRSDPYEPELDRIERQRRLEEPPPTPQEPSPTVQDSLFGDVRFSTDQNAPGMPFETWNMINDPEHFIKSRGKITNIEQMSPSEYISRVSRDVFPTFGEAAIRQQRDRTGQIPSIMQAMEEGTEFGLPMIHYDQGGSRFPTQEGLHRAMAAERLGIPEIPVAIHQLDRSPAARAARAEEFGFTTDVYHGTRSDFSEFDPNMVDIGIHVGSPSQATNRLLDESSGAVTFSGNLAKGVTRARSRFDEGSQILPLKAKIDNVLEMPDVGEWKNSFNVIDELIKHPRFKHKVPELQEMRKFAEEEGVLYRDDYGDSTWDTAPENRELLDELNTLIRNEGFDTIKYLNEHENNLIRRTNDDPHSYIILDPKNVRSPSADFNPLRMNEADLQAGVASLGATEGVA